MNSFQEKIFRIVKRIPKGKVLTYKKVAELAGYPRSWRGVGNVLKKNKNKKIPCHRVIRSDGKAGGFNKGEKRKIVLLEKEGIKIKK
jgi:O-6-methylguanine DNA methyltransferase